MLPLIFATAGVCLATSTRPPSRKAIVTDVDGTLFSFAGRDLSAGNRQALADCSDAGVHVCLATGRIPGPWFTALKAELPNIGPCVFGNGALVVNECGDPIWESQLPPEIVSAVLEYTRGGTAGEGDMRLCVLAATRWDSDGLRYCELAPSGEASAITALIERAGEPDAVLLRSLDGFVERNVAKFVIWTMPGEEGWASMPQVVAALRLRLHGLGATILDHGDRWCEVLPPGVNKGSGVLRMLEWLGVEPAEAVAVGDAENDVEMLRLVGVGAAVANAQPDALAAADVAVASNGEDGVAEVVRRFVLRDQSDEAPPIEFFTLEMCPYAQRCWIVLEELGVPYTPRAVELRGNETEREWYERNVNPRSKVPAIRDAETGLAIFESLIINEYLAERCVGGRALLPIDAPTRARIRLWNEHLDTQLAPAHFTLLMNKDAQTEPAKRAALDAALAHYEERLVGPYLCGATFTLADAAALPFFERLVFSLRHYKGLDTLAAYPRTSTWLETAMARESFQTTRRPEEKLVALYDRFLAVDYSFGGLNKNG